MAEGKAKVAMIRQPTETFEPRPYQKRGSEKIRAGWKDFRRQLLVFATGTGKTVLFSGETKHEVDQGNRVLILAHRDRLLQQAADKLRRSTGLDAVLEKAENFAPLDAPVVVGSQQTLCRENRLHRFPSNHFDLIIIDEAHRTLSPTYLRILDHFSPARVLGVTATPDRADKKDLGQFYEHIADEYQLGEAVEDGYLSRVVVETLPLEISLNIAPKRGDFPEGEVADLLTPMLDQIAAQIWSKAKERKTMVFMPTIDTSITMAESMREAGFDSRWVASTSADPDGIIDWFSKAGKGSALVNPMLLTEGFDEPSVDCIVNLRATRSRPLYAQIVGRGTRLFPGKENCLVLDFLWHCEKHLLVRPAHIVAKTDEIAQRMIEKGSGDLLEMQAESERDALEALQKKLAQNQKKKARTIDPLAVGAIVGNLDLADYEPIEPWESLPATAQQIASLDKAGVDTRGIGRGQASKLLSLLYMRREMGLCTLKQARLLTSMGHRNVAHWTKEQATRAVMEMKRIGFARYAARMKRPARKEWF